MNQQQSVQAPKGVRLFAAEPMLVRYQDAVRFLWGDEESGQVNDIIYGRGERISCLLFTLPPGGRFTSSKQWKAMFDQHRFYYVLQGELTVLDPQSGEVAVAGVAEAVHWQGAKWHFGYNFSDEETIVADWYAPQERPPDIPEVEFGKTKPQLEAVVHGRYELLGRWPQASREVHARALSEGGVVTLGMGDALHLIDAAACCVRESLYLSSDELTAGAVRLPAGAKGGIKEHPGDKVILVRAGRLNVYCPASYDWFEVHPWDCLYLPANTPHQYWNYTGETTELIFCVVPRYR